MAKPRRYSIVVTDEKSNTVVVTATVDWTSDDKHMRWGRSIGCQDLRKARVSLAD